MERIALYADYALNPPLRKLMRLDKYASRSYPIIVDDTSANNVLGFIKSCEIYLCIFFIYN